MLWEGWVTKSLNERKGIAPMESLLEFTIKEIIIITIIYFPKFKQQSLLKKTSQKRNISFLNTLENPLFFKNTFSLEIQNERRKQSFFNFNLNSLNFLQSESWWWLGRSRQGHHHLNVMPLRLLGWPHIYFYNVPVWSSYLFLCLFGHPIF